MFELGFLNRFRGFSRSSKESSSRVFSISLSREAPDVCYSWWILSALVTIDRAHWIDMQKLAGRGEQELVFSPFGGNKKTKDRIERTSSLDFL